MKNNILWLDTTDSTNSEMYRKISQLKLDEFFTIATSFQTNGKGQGNNTWFSEAGKNLLASILIYPQFLKTDHFFYLNKITSLAVVDTIKNFIPDCNLFIKWPNDIYVDDYKIAGILIQNELATYKFSKSIIGIGLNVNQDYFPHEIPNPISLFLLNQRIYDISEILDYLIQSLKNWYLKLYNNEFLLIDNKYLAQLYAIKQTRLFCDKNNIVFKGIIENITFDGKIQINQNDNLNEYDFKEVEFYDLPKTI